MVNPAALKALAEGDFANAMVASTPGGIERQEATGQRNLVSSFNRLPKDGLAKHGDALAALGFKVLGDHDDIFVNIEAPAGWALRPTEHSMHSDIVDAEGHCRGSVFYKAAFYDRRADFQLHPRYKADADYGDKEYRATVTDAVGKQVLYRSEPVPSGDYSAQDAADAVARAWLAERFPDHASVLAYWPA